MKAAKLPRGKVKIRRRDLGQKMEDTLTADVVTNAGRRAVIC